MKRTNKRPPLSVQMKKKSNNPIQKKKEYDGDFDSVISTGSTLLDLAISGGRVRGGGIPSKILVEIFGPSGTGKTVLLCEIAGSLQRNKGEVIFRDPESRLNKQFARMFDLDTDAINYSTPNTVTDVFHSIRDHKFSNQKVINGCFIDSLAALSTNMEMDNKDGDKMGMRRAKEFSEELRKSARIITERNLLVVCSNQVRVNQDAGPYGQKYVSPGGEAIGFYSSLRLRTSTPAKIKKPVKVHGKEIKRVVGIQTTVEVYKSSVDKPYRTAPIIIYFDYGIDDIRANLQYVKDFTKNNTYTVNGQSLSNSMEDAIQIVEEDNLENELREEVIDLWEEIEEKFQSNRKSKKR